MSAIILDGKKVAAEVQEELKRKVEAVRAEGNRAPGLAVVRVGDDPASEVYVRNKERTCAELGMETLGVHLPATSSQEEVHDTIVRLNADERVDGILLQLPLPEGLSAEPLLELIRADKDVDGFHPDNSGRLLAGHPRFVPCTPRGILEILDRYEVPLKGARAVVIGRSNIVGKPVALLLLARHATVTLCHSRTRDLPAVAREADLLVSATGVPGSVGADFIKPGATVIDVGTSRVTDPEIVRTSVHNPRRLGIFEKKGALLLGDVRFDEAAEVAGRITPVPGGVGPLTVAMLMRNAWESYCLRHSREP